MCKKLIMLCVVAVFSMQNACHNVTAQPIPAGTTSPEEFIQFYPLAVGNQWTFKGKMVGVLTQHTITIIKKDENAFIDNSGAALSIDKFGIRDRKRYMLRGPVEKGTKWMSIPSASAVEHYEIIAVGERKTVPAGTFDGCVTVRSSTRLNTRRVLHNDITFAPKVGIIAIKTMMLEDGHKQVPQVHMQLESYKLNNG